MLRSRSYFATAIPFGRLFGLSRDAPSGPCRFRGGTEIPCLQRSAGRRPFFGAADADAGGGRSRGQEDDRPIEIRARITELGGIPRERLNCEPGKELGAEGAPTLWDELIDRTLRELDSVGGVIECTCDKVPVGLGEPFFDSLESQLAHLAFSIPAVRGIEFGDGFAAARMKGSEHNDCFVNGEGKTATNGAGGINGGISNGNPVVFRIAVKPTSSIAKKQYTFNFATGRMEEFVVKGRHDAASPCAVRSWWRRSLRSRWLTTDRFCRKSIDFSKSDICSAEYYSYYNICPAEVSLLDSMLKRKEYSNTGKYVFPVLLMIVP